MSFDIRFDFGQIVGLDNQKMYIFNWQIKKIIILYMIYIRVNKLNK